MAVYTPKVPVNHSPGLARHQELAHKERTFAEFEEHMAVEEYNWDSAASAASSELHEGRVPHHVYQLKAAVTYVDSHTA